MCSCCPSIGHCHRSKVFWDHGFCDASSCTEVARLEDGAWGLFEVSRVHSFERLLFLAQVSVSERVRVHCVSLLLTGRVSRVQECDGALVDLRINEGDQHLLCCGRQPEHIQLTTICRRSISRISPPTKNRSNASIPRPIFYLIGNLCK